jgi:hypothetical protein
VTKFVPGKLVIALLSDSIHVVIIRLIPAVTKLVPGMLVIVFVSDSS